MISNSVIDGYFTLFSSKTQVSWTKDSRETLELNAIIHQIHLADIYRISHSNMKNIYSIKQSMDGSLSQIVHLMEHRIDTE